MKKYVFLGILLIFITSPNSDLRNALIKKQPKIPPKIDEKTTTKSSKIGAKIQHRFLHRFLSILEQLFHGLGTTLGDFSDKLVVRGVSRRPIFAFRDASWPQFPHLAPTFGHSWPIATQTASSWPLSNPSGGSRTNFWPDFEPQNHRKPSRNHPQTSPPGFLQPTPVLSLPP